MTSQSTTTKDYIGKILGNLNSSLYRRYVDRTYELLKSKGYQNQYEKYILTPLVENYKSDPTGFFDATKNLFEYFKKNEPYKLFDELKKRRRNLSKEEMIANWFTCMALKHDTNGRGVYSRKLPSEVKDEEKRNYSPSLGELEHIVLSRNKSKR